MQLLFVGRRFLNRTARQATFWKPKYYEAIPHYVKPHFIDIHDSYKLRSLQEVNAELKGRQFEISVQRVLYSPTDISADLKVEMAQFELTQLQLQRLKVLVGCRYNETTNQLKLTCELFDTFQQNHTKIHQMFYEIIMQTKRAP